MLDFTPAQTLWVIAAAVVGQSHVAINRRILPVIGCKQKHTNSNYFVDMDTKKY